MQCLLTTLFLFCIASSCYGFYTLEQAEQGGTLTFNVLDYGAVGDGRTDASLAFMRAWRAVCGVAGEMPTLLVPAGTIFLLQPLIFYGPCRSNNLHVQISGTLIAPSWVSAYLGKDKWLQFSDINGLIVDGGGEIDGQGHIWWKYSSRGDAGFSRPSALSFHNCNISQLRGLRHVNSQRNHISINSCFDFKISNLQIIAPEDSPNTDGIDISASSYIRIENSVIATGDDCIAINGLSSNINIYGIKCGPGHGISIGSLGRNGAYETVEEVHVENCVFRGTQNGVRIKTWKGGSGYVRKITFEKIILEAVRNPIIINQNYIDHAMDNNDLDIKISDITYREVHGSSADETAIRLECSDKEGCSNIVMEHINITSSSSGKQAYAFCNNAHGESIYACPKVSCLSRSGEFW